MKLTKAFRDMVIKVIKDDGSLGNYHQNWWTEFTDPKGSIYKVNVYDVDAFGDEVNIPYDDFLVDVYDVYTIDGYYVTDENPMASFAIMGYEK